MDILNFREEVEKSDHRSKEAESISIAQPDRKRSFSDLSENHLQHQNSIQCVECEDQHAEVLCNDCDEHFCRPCWDSIHRKGARKIHTTQPVLGKLMPNPNVNIELSDKCDNRGEVLMSQDASSNGACTDNEMSQPFPFDEKNDPVLVNMVEICRYVPLRLTVEERQLLAVLQSTLNISEYTDRVDVYSSRSKRETVQNEIESILATIIGLSVAAKVPGALKLLKADSVFEHSQYFSRVFEVGRRYKISNPAKMRSTYGKLMFMLQDSTSIKGLPKLVTDIRMVTNQLEVMDPESLLLLKDPRILTATSEIIDNGSDGLDIQKKLDRKLKARRDLVNEYESAMLTCDMIALVLDSINDGNNYLECNVGPVSDMLDMLMNNFDPEKIVEPYSLQLTSSYRSSNHYGYDESVFGGDDSSTSYFSGRSRSVRRNNKSNPKLNHDHKTQFRFVEQSLKLWTRAMTEMYKLWMAADGDLLNGRASYRLSNTGQGLNRVQTCPSVSAAMRGVLRSVQVDVGNWVGLSVVHLGDRDVPNALVFIDKYMQIPQILSQIRNVVTALDTWNRSFAAESHPGMEEYVKDNWESVEALKMSILCDYFKHGFDGDGDDGTVACCDILISIPKGGDILLTMNNVCYDMWKSDFLYALLKT